MVSSVKAIRTTREGSPLIELPQELRELIYWHCDPATSACLGAVNRDAHEDAESHCWSKESWLVARVPLHLLLQKAGMSEDVCLRRLAAHPLDARAMVDPEAYNGDGRCSVLHLAFEKRPEFEALLLAVLKAHPAAAHERDADYGLLPLESACEQGAALPVIGALLEVHQAAGGVPPNHGGITGGVCAPHPNALHLAVINGASHRVVCALLRVSPVLAHAWAAEDVFRDDWCEHTPLHFAAIYGSHAGGRASRVIQALLAAHPRAIATREGRSGMLPLHLAALSAAPIEAITSLAQAFPAALRIKDDLGRTPLECARSGIAGAVMGAVEDGVGYTYLEYCGLNPKTRERLKYRQTEDHAARVIACLERLTASRAAAHGDTASSSGSASGSDEPSDDGAAAATTPAAELEPPALTWRYHMDDARYGQVLPAAAQDVQSEEVSCE